MDVHVPGYAKRLPVATTMPGVKVGGFLCVLEISPLLKMSTDTTWPEKVTTSEFPKSNRHELILRRLINPYAAVG